MDGNKDEASRCFKIAEEAIASGNKKRGLKFVKIAQRLNPGLVVDELLAACEKIDSESNAVREKRFDDGSSSSSSKAGVPKGEKIVKGEGTYTEEHVRLIRKINKNSDYYVILGVEKKCSVDEIRKAYRKLSLKVHPDKNKAPGSEEAFKKVAIAFKCLSDNNSRMQYDQAGLVDEFEHVQRQTPRRRRRQYARDLFDGDIDPDEIFRAFFGQNNSFRAHVNRATRERSSQQQPAEPRRGPSLMTCLQILPFLLIFFLAYLPFSEPDYSLHKSNSYQILQTSEEHGIDYYVKSDSFDSKFPPGSPARAKIEDDIFRDYKNSLYRSCQIEIQKRRWSRQLPTPHCDRLQELGLIDRIYG